MLNTFVAVLTELLSLDRAGAGRMIELASAIQANPLFAQSPPSMLGLKEAELNLALSFDVSIVTAT
jgi:hypothetical protein